MDKKVAKQISNFIETSVSPIYEITKLETVNGRLPRFHQWTNGKSVISGFQVIKMNSDTSYFLLFIDWHRNENYYLVIYTHDKKTTLAEMHQVEEWEGSQHLFWKYTPLKRDGKNDQRKAYFKQTFGSTTVHIPLPKSNLEVEDFFSQLFKLCMNRLKADKIVDIFDLS